MTIEDADHNQIYGQICEVKAIDVSGGDVDLSTVVRNKKFTQVGIYIGGIGDVKFDTVSPADGTITTGDLPAVPGGTVLYGWFTKVYQAGTTATGLRALS